MAVMTMMASGGRQSVPIQYPLLLYLAVWCCCCFTFVACFISNQEQQQQSSNDNNNDKDCQLYLAESTMPDAGWGIFVGGQTTYGLGDIIEGSGSIGIPFIDGHRHIFRDELLRDFVFATSNTGGWQEASVTEMILPGVGMLANRHPTHHNVFEKDVEYSSSNNKDEPTSVMAGSYTHYHNFAFRASREIQPGDELFLAAEDEWMEWAVQPTQAQVRRWKEILHSLLQTFDIRTLEEESPTNRTITTDKHKTLLTSAQWVDLLFRLRTEILPKLDDTVDPKVAEYLPKTYDDLVDMYEHHPYLGRNLSSVLQRNVTWLEQHGYCLDHIVTTTTTITTTTTTQQQQQQQQQRRPQSTVNPSPFMGHMGGIAKRAISKNSVVTPIPLIPIMMHDESMRRAMKQQLLWNYCFGHADSSTLLLCPTTHVMLINHAPSSLSSEQQQQQQQQQQANVVLRWAKSSSNRRGVSSSSLSNLELWTEPSMNDALQWKHPRQHVSERSTRLMMELVALRDIQEGEELFMDYGAAWEAHLQHYLQQQEEEQQRHLTPSPKLQEQDYQTWDTECRLEPFLREYHHGSSSIVLEDYSLTAAKNADPSRWPIKTRTLAADNQYISWYPCQIIMGGDDNDVDDNPKKNKKKVTGRSAKRLAHVHIYSKDGIGGERRLVRRYQNFPRHAIRTAMVQPYTSPMHSPNAFRHYISIPNDIFPLAWRDSPSSSYQTASTLRLGYEEVGPDMALPEHESLRQDYEQLLRSVTCGSYIAPSNIPNAGFGTYTAVRIPGKNAMIETYIPIVALLRGIQPFEWSVKKWSLVDYVWDAAVFATEYEAVVPVVDASDYGSLRTALLTTNQGTLANSHPGLVNSRVKNMGFRPLLDKCRDPGAGGHTEYSGYFETSAIVEAGEELFVSYGDKWFLDRPKFKDVPIERSYQEADVVMASVLAMMMSSSSSTKREEEEEKAILHFMTNTIVQEHRTKMALGVDKYTLDDILQRNGTARATVQKRSPAWLEENGQCMDHAFLGQSRIKQAGNGLFVRRHIPKGGTIISSPTIATWGEEVFDINVTAIPSPVEINPKRLILNYHFSHPNSSLYLFPLTQAAGVNHNALKANAKIVWSPTNKRSQYLLQRPIEELRKELYSSLVMDLVATRDIRADEEVYIDYGRAWEKAWQKHVREFRGDCEQPATFPFMNENKFRSEYFEWSDHHFSICYQPTEQMSKENVDLVQETDVYENMIGWYHYGFDLALTRSDRPPCVILSANTAKRTFDVVSFVHRTPEEEKAGAPRRLHRIRQLPENHVEYLPKPFTSNLFWKGGFRHEIHIPDDIFPAHWRDLE